MAALPVDSWQDYWEARIGHFIADTLGNPEEEHIGSYIDIVFGLYAPPGKPQMKKLGSNSGSDRGARVLDVYLLAHGGRWLGQSLFTFEGRQGTHFLALRKSREG